MNNVVRYKIPLPSVDEQNDIVNYLDSISLQFENVIKKTENLIALGKERRTALISAAVTGKIDVRNWQPAQYIIPMEVSA